MVEGGEADYCGELAPRALHPLGSVALTELFVPFIKEGAQSLEGGCANARRPARPAPKQSVGGDALADLRHEVAHVVLALGRAIETRPVAGLRYEGCAAELAGLLRRRRFDRCVRHGIRPCVRPEMGNAHTE